MKNIFLLLVFTVCTVQLFGAAGGGGGGAAAGGGAAGGGGRQASAADRVFFGPGPLDASAQKEVKRAVDPRGSVLNLPRMSQESKNKVYKLIAQKYERDRRFEAAAEMYEKAGDTENTQRLYGLAAEKDEGRGYFGMAARMYEKAGDTVNAQRWYRFAAEQDERRGLFSSAAELYEEAGDIVNAQRLYRRAATQNEIGEYFGTAVRLYEKAGDRENAQRLYRPAAEQYEEYRNFSYAAEMYEKAGDTVNAQRSYRLAAEQYERDRNFRYAARMYEKLGEIVNAQRSYRLAAEENEIRGSFQSAAEMYEKLGDIETFLLFRYLAVHQSPEIKSAIRPFLGKNQHTEMLQDLLEKKLVSEKVYSLFMVGGKSPLSFVRGRTQFEKGKRAPAGRYRFLFPNREELDRAARLLQDDIPKSSPIFDRAVDTANRADALAAYRRRVTSSSKKQDPKDEE